MNGRSIVLLFALLAGPCHATQDAAPRLSAYLTSHPWSPSKSGPMVVIDPDSTKGSAGAKSLADFDRMQKSVGSVTAIVPRQMVVIDDTFSQPPNMYDGLDRNAKVLYLLSTLSEGQWRLVLKDGIAMSDLNKEQQKVFLSLLPNPFVWRSYQVDEKEDPKTTISSGTLTQQELPGIRLYIGRELSLAVHRVGMGNVFSFLPNSGTPPNTTVYSRDTSARSDVFGVQVKSSAPNEPKLSDLSYTRFKTVVSVLPQSTVKELLNAVGQATGTEFHADLRIANLPVWTYGTKVEAGDLLKSLALGVTGTFRHVGTSYDLTSDRMGLGTRKVNFALWENNLLRDERTRSAQWQKTIGTGGQIFKATFEPNDPTAPSPDLFTPEDDVSPVPSRFVPAGQLSPGIRQILNRAAETLTSQLDLSSAALTSEFKYGFALPNGQKLIFEGSVGRTIQFKNSRQPMGLPAGVPSGNPQMSLESSKCIVAAAPKSPSDSKEFVDLAAHEGVTEIWIETDDLQTLLSAIEAAKSDHLQLRFMVHPWSFAPNQKPEDPDLTILGDTYTQLEGRKQTADWNSNRLTRNWIGGWEEPMFGPMDRSVRQRWQQIGKLAKTPGLTGVVLVATAPPGYEGKRTGRTNGIGTAIVESIGFGYSTAQRLAFLRANEMDPIDIPPRGVSILTDLQQPFFLDEALRGNQGSFDGADPANPEVAAMQEKWDKFRGELNHGSVQDLVDLLDPAGPPVMMEKRNTSISFSASERSMAVWSKGQELIQVPEEPFGKRVSWDGAMLFHDVTDRSRLIPLQNSRVTTVIAVGRLSIADAKELLDRAFGK